MLKQIRNLLLIFIGIVMLGFLAMIITYSLPINKIHNRIISDVDSYFHIYQLISNDDTTILDLYTDAIILGEISFYNTDKSIISNALSVYGPGDGVTSFLEYVNGNISVICPYERYWHGNLFILKPLFYLFDYNTIKFIGFFVQTLMLLYVIKLMKKNNIEQYILPFIVAIFLIHPEVIGLSFQYSAMYNLLLIALIIMLKYKNILLKKNRIIYFFLVIGMLTSFFDFLTYPAITFGVPIIFYFLFEQDKNLKNKIFKIIIYGLIWSLGYLGMWFSKWLISGIILHRDSIGEAVSIIFYRTSTEKFSRIDTIFKNILIYNKKSYITIFGLIFIYYFIRIFKNRKNINKNTFIKVIPFIIIAMIPFIWYFIICNHSYIHYWMTYRELLIFFFAMLCGLEIFVENDRRSKNEKK